MAWHIPDDRFRIQDPRIPMAQNRITCPDEGAFMLPPKIGSRKLLVIASSGGGWEHASISVRQGKTVLTPTWEECCYVKATFWDEEDCVIQYHPPKSEYVNMHEHVLHLWRPTDQATPLPPSIFVGVNGVKFTGKETRAELAQKAALVEQMLADV